MRESNSSITKLSITYINERIQIFSSYCKLNCVFYLCTNPRIIDHYQIVYNRFSQVKLIVYLLVPHGIFPGCKSYGLIFIFSASFFNLIEINMLYVNL